MAAGTRARHRLGERDPFPRCTATPGALAPWLMEAARSLPGLAASYGPVAAIDARLRRRRPPRPTVAAGELAPVAAALPLALPLLAGAAAMRAIGRVAPPLPEVRMPGAGEANLLVHLIAESVPTYLANSAVRLAVL